MTACESGMTALAEAVVEPEDSIISISSSPSESFRAADTVTSTVLTGAALMADFCVGCLTGAAAFACGSLPLAFGETERSKETRFLAGAGCGCGDWATSEALGFDFLAVCAVCPEPDDEGEDGTIILRFALGREGATSISSTKSQPTFRGEDGDDVWLLSACRSPVSIPGLSDELECAHRFRCCLFRLCGDRSRRLLRLLRSFDFELALLLGGLCSFRRLACLALPLPP